MLRLLLPVGLVVALVATASAHVPDFEEAGTSPETAFPVQEPDQSRVFYGTLEAGTQHWFRFEREQGDPIDASIQLPAGEEARPVLWLAGPGIPGEGPRGTPAGLGGMRAAAMGELSIEPFTPLAMRAVGELGETAPQDGTYYVVIEAEAAATYSVAIGLGESFTPYEWVVIPAQRIGIMDWAGIPWPLAMVGEVLAVAFVLAVALRRGTPVRSTLGLAAAAAIAGTAVTMLVLALVATAQAGASAALLVPMLFAALAAGIGFGAYRAVRHGHAWQAMAWAAGAVVVWAGLLIGPAALVAWSLWHWRVERSAGRDPRIRTRARPTGR